MEDTLYWAKVKENAIIPTKREEDAGYDIYPLLSCDPLIIPHGHTAMIPTGIACAFPSGYVLILKERGSTGTKGIAQRAGVVDSGYRGEIQVPITNSSTTDLLITSNPERYNDLLRQTLTVIPADKAICQAVLIVSPNLRNEVVDYDQLRAMESLRGTTGFGASGK